MTKDAPHGELRVVPIGVARTPFTDRQSAPRQPPAAAGVRGTIELFPDGRFEHALEDLASFSHLWVLFWFHLNEGWTAKVRPPRSEVRRGLFATRAPYRPNPIGMSAVRLERIEGLVLHVSDVDLLDGTPVLDLKPYIPYTDSIPTANHGWLEPPAADAAAAPADPRAAHEVRFTAEAEAELAFLRESHGIDLRPRILEVLSLGVTPHPYRRIRKEGDGFKLALKEWRACFVLDGGAAVVTRIVSGYRPSELFSAKGDSLAPHRDFTDRFGAG
ncbi:MAG TPA: tRNA (N6-threonylcarbamoyladenosine(37)-N6)-methyltransferase TrmO [Polyangiaceae bacterium]|nr:tRNA (N6-threonylcarbamoyladenosine(37)-N6)-methyltransferase TrmO [Polyangiaceae bacterium]